MPLPRNPGFTPAAGTTHLKQTAIRFLPLLSVAALLLATFRLYSYSYFWLDDFNALYQVQTQSAAQMMGHLLNPASSFFRPAGMMVYWLMFRLFDLNSNFYHYLAWSIHAANTALVYVLLKRITRSVPGAAIGGMLFASQTAFSDIYWNFGDISHLLSAFLMLAGILLWMDDRRSWTRVLLCFLLFFLALKAKEVAVILPASWLLVDILVRRKFSLKMTAPLLIPAGFGLWYGLRKTSEMGSPLPSHPFYMDLKWVTLGRGYGTYFNNLFDTHFRWQLWAIGFTALLLLLVWRRNREALFFQLHVFVAFLPVIFLVNHRDAFYWYIPFVGLSGLAALFVKALLKRVEPKVPVRIAIPVANIAFMLLCWGTYVAERNGSQARRLWQQQIATDYRGIVQSLRSMPPPSENETIFFDSYPPYFLAGDLLFVSQVALQRTDIDAKLATEPSPSVRYRLHFQNSQLVQVK